MKKPLIFDLDDTFFDTSFELRRILKEVHGFDVGHEDYLSDHNTNGLLSVIHESSDFMSSAPLFEELEELPQILRSQMLSGRQTGICTHRGFHPNAQALSHVAFKRYGFSFDYEHYLCPVKQPNKIEFLNSVYGVENYVLFDDNPKGRHVTSITEENVYLIDQAFNRHIKAANRIKVGDIPFILSTLAW